MKSFLQGEKWGKLQSTVQGLNANLTDGATR